MAQVAYLALQMFVQFKLKEIMSSPEILVHVTINIYLYLFCWLVTSRLKSSSEQNLYEHILDFEVSIDKVCVKC